MDGVRKEDIRDIWDAIRPSGFWRMIHYSEPGCPCEAILKDDGDAAWEELEHVIDVSIEEWRAEKAGWLRFLREAQELFGGDD